MLARRLPGKIERLESLAQKTGRTKSYYAREAIFRYLQDLARHRLARGGRRVTLESLERNMARRSR
jgi:RHH-type rel operon transcriptional repressor/antitoxin RelB